MSDYIPFEIQSNIIKRFPVKSIVRFRSVSKQWKSFIDCPEFIKSYHINHPNPQQRLLLQYNLVQTYALIIDDNTFPQQKFHLITPELLNLLRRAMIVGSVDGLLCFYGHLDVDLKTKMAVLWNPSVRKCVGIVIPNVLDSPYAYTRIGFGVCPETNDPKLVKINVVRYPSSYWEVQVFTLSSRVWKTVYMGAPFKSCDLMWDHVFIDGIFYWGSYGFIISYDLKSEKFSEVSIPERLAITSKVVKVNESLGLLEFYEEGGLPVCGVWMRKDAVNQPFTKIYTIKVEGKMVGISNVLGFRNNGDVLLGIMGDDFKDSTVEVYEPSSGHIICVGIKGYYGTFSASSYMETLLLLDQPNSIFH